MSDASSPRPASAPLCGPTDTMELIGGCRGKGRDTGCREWIYVVVHRSHGAWTHVYAAVECPGRVAAEIRLIRVMAGERLSEARSWALAMRGEDAIGRARAEDDLYRRGLAWHRQAPRAAEGTVAGHRAVQELACPSPAVH